MAVDQRRYYATETQVMDRRMLGAGGGVMSVATAYSFTLAKRIAAALNLYRPKVRRRKSAEKAV